jgi:hypothetical protein
MKKSKQILIGLIMFIISGSNTAKAQEEIVYNSGIDVQKNSLCETPNPGNISFAVEEMKDETIIRKYTIYAQNLSHELGISYQWQFFSVKDQKWKDLTSENLTQLIIVNDGKSHSTYYRFKTTCHKNGISSYSNKVLIL